MTPQRIECITTDYYSRFCGTSLSRLGAGTHFVCSEERGAKLKGFGCKYAVYLLVRGDLCAVSYSPKHQKWLEGLKGYGKEQLVAAVCRRFPLKKKQLMLFEKELVTDYGNAKILKAADYPLYETFFREAYPGADPGGWLYAYFAEKTEKEYFTGYLSGGRLLSVCDAPDMPYLGGIIQHTGIYTLPEARRKGYAARAAALAAHHLLERGICPQWECGADNTASIGLAKSIGYREYGTAYILEEWE